MKSENFLQPIAKVLRNNSTDTERFLWRYLRNSQLEGVKFRRQQPIEGFIVDFISFTPPIIIELDGGQHADEKNRDEARDRCLRANSFTVLRFWDNEVFENIEGVLEVIRLQGLNWLHPPPSPLPSREGELKFKTKLEKLDHD